MKLKYREWYTKIISKAKLENRKKEDGIYYENHHILPKSLFPLWEKRKSNLVLLTAREHFFCHQLLNKIYPGEKMFLAVWFLANIGQNKYCIKGSKEYEKLKIRHSNILKEIWTEERKEEARIKSIIAYYGSYEIYKEKVEKELQDKLKIIRQKTIDRIINDCRENIKKQEAKKKREKRHIELLAIKQDREQRRINGLLRPKKGFKLSEEHKQKIRESNKGKNKGRIPWSKGKHWITDETGKRSMIA